MSDSTDSKAASPRFVRCVARAADGEHADRLAAEAWAAGASGIEERDLEAGVELVIYALASVALEVRAALESIGGTVGDLESVPETDWSERWKRDLVAIEVSPRLVVRPSFVSHACARGQAELVIDPGQAFGTGGHASTLLALEWIDSVAPRLAPGGSVLDVGTGTGVLALAAARLARAKVVAFDLDPLAASTARENARRNRLSEALLLFTGPIDALGEHSFDFVVANLLKSELLPMIGSIAARTRQGGLAAFSGLLASESDEVVAALAAEGFALAGVREAEDARGDRWSALLMAR